MEKLSLLLLVVKKSLIGTAIVSVLGFCGLYNFSDTCKNEKNNNVNKTVKEGGPREQLPRTFKEGGPREQLPRT